jgi:hypothetical protein
MSAYSSALFIRRETLGYHDNSGSASGGGERQGDQANLFAGIAETGGIDTTEGLVGRLKTPLRDADDLGSAGVLDHDSGASRSAAGTTSS